MNEEPSDKKSLYERLKQTVAEINDLGGWDAFKSGQWLPALIRRAFRAYYDNANAEFLREKYPHASDDEIIKKLIGLSAKYAALLGAVTGASVSANEISAIVTGTASGGLSLPAQMSIAGASLAAEAIFLVRIQLQLIASIAKLIGVPLNPDDPEDILLILGFAVGGAGVEGLGKVGAKAAGHATKGAIRGRISGPTLEALKRFGNRLGMKILQRSIIKYAMPLVSMLFGGGWNYIATRSVGKVAVTHFRAKKIERSPRSSKTAHARERSKKTTPSSPRILPLNLRREFFDAIADGTKTAEYREYKPYWTKRLDGREFDEIHFRNGYATNAPFMRVEFGGVKAEGRGAKKRYAIALGRVLEVKRP